MTESRLICWTSHAPALGRCLLPEPRAGPHACHQCQCRALQRRLCPTNWLPLLGAGRLCTTRSRTSCARRPCPSVSVLPILAAPCSALCINYAADSLQCSCCSCCACPTHCRCRRRSASPAPPWLLCRRRAAGQHWPGAWRCAGEGHCVHAAAVGPAGARGGRGRHWPPLRQVGAEATGGLFSFAGLQRWVLPCRVLLGNRATGRWHGFQLPSLACRVAVFCAPRGRCSLLSCSSPHRLLRELAVSSPPAFICHYYNHYFAHTGG